jgi:signal transduction histidine kinase
MAPMGETSTSTAWSLQRRVNRGIVAVLALLLVLIAVVVLALVDVKQKGDDVIDRWDPALLNSSGLSRAMVNQETGVRGFVISKGNETFLEPYTEFQDLQQQTEARLRTYLAGETDLIDDLDALHESIADWQQTVAEPTIAAVRSGDETALADYNADESKAAFDDVRTRLNALMDSINDLRHTAQDARTRAFYYVWVIIGVGAALLLVVGLVVARLLRRSVLDPISRLVDQSRQVAAGDLGKEIEVSGPLEIENLAHDVELMRERLATQLARVERARLRIQQRSSELARSNADLEQFAYVASHDLSEPLRKVTNFCQLLERQYGDQLDDKARTYIAFMVDGAKRMQILINDLLAFSRVGRTTEHFESVDLNASLRRARSNLESQIEETGAYVVVQGDLPTVPGDPTLLTALLQNLIGNAVKYRDPARRPVVEISAVRDGEHWLLAVQDNGIGIDPQYAERIFTIFQRLHLRDAYGGTGIGLALCRKIVEFHRGRLWLAESEDTGARFELTLPVQNLAPDAADDDEPSLRAHS